MPYIDEVAKGIDRGVDISYLAFDLVFEKNWEL